MADRTEDGDRDDPKAAQTARLKAALKANMARRKAQERTAPPNHHGRRAGRGDVKRG